MKVGIGVDGSSSADSASMWLESRQAMLLDGNELGKGREYFRFGGVDLSPDHRLVAWSFDGNGSEFYELRLRDTVAGSDLADVLENTAGEATWTADGKQE